MTLPGTLKRCPVYSVYFGPGNERVGSWVREENVLVAYGRPEQTNHFSGRNLGMLCEQAEQLDCGRLEASIC